MLDLGVASFRNVSAIPRIRMVKGETRNTHFSHFITHFARENCDYRTIKRLVCRKCFRKIALNIAAIVYVSFYDQCSQIRTLVPKPNFLIEAISWHFLFSFFSLSLSFFLFLLTLHTWSWSCTYSQRIREDGDMEERKKKVNEMAMVCWSVGSKIGASV